MKNIFLSNFFLGYGRNAMNIMFSEEYSYMRVGNIHSDILRMYMETGFVLFVLWVFNYFIYFLPHIFYNLLPIPILIFNNLPIIILFFS